MSGEFSFFSRISSLYIPNAADLTHVLSNMLTKDKPAKVVWTELDNNANMLYANARGVTQIRHGAVNRLV